MPPQTPTDLRDFSLPAVTGYHSHVYFDAQTYQQAQTLCEAAARILGVKMGRMHQKPVGPHPDWSCQLSYPADRLSDVLPWLAEHRNGLTIFTHPLTGHDLLDHRDHAIWMGSIRPLDLSIFS